MEVGREIEPSKAEQARQDLIEAVITALRLDPSNPVAGVGDYKKRIEPDNEFMWMELIKGKREAADQDEDLDHIVELVTLCRDPNNPFISTLALIDLEAKQATDEDGQELDYDSANRYRIIVQTLFT